jgi:hypothetical protein
MMRGLVLLVCVLTSCGCVLHLHMVPSYRCQDGLPIRVLVDVACRDGICGYTCAPDRWKDVWR